MVTEGVTGGRGEGCGGAAGVWVGAASPLTDGHAWAAEEPWVAIEGLRRGWVRLLPLLVVQRWGGKAEPMGHERRRLHSKSRFDHLQRCFRSYRPQENARSRTWVGNLSVWTTNSPLPSFTEPTFQPEHPCPPRLRWTDASKLCCLGSCRANWVQAAGSAGVYGLNPCRELASVVKR